MTCIQHLSDKTLLKIFLHTVKFQGEEDTPTVSMASPPIAISQVCHPWRTLAINEKEMWSTFYLRNAQWSTAPLLSLWLNRSKDALLSFYARMNLRGPDPGYKNADDFA